MNRRAGESLVTEETAEGVDEEGIAGWQPRQAKPLVAQPPLIVLPAPSCWATTTELVPKLRARAPPHVERVRATHAATALDMVRRFKANETARVVVVR